MRSLLRSFVTAQLAAFLLVPLSSAQVFFFVSRYDDTAPTTGGVSGDLRAAITAANANPGSHVQVLAPLHGSATIVLQAPLPIITASMTIDKVGGTTTVSGNNLYRIFFIDAPGATVTIADLTLDAGRAKGGDGGVGGGGGGLGAGGAIFANAGAVVAQRVKFTGNAALGGNAQSQEMFGLKGGGGGGGLGGNGGDGGGSFGGGGGGGFGGNGGAANGGPGGGGGLVAPGGNGSSSSGSPSGGGGGALGPGGHANGSVGGTGGSGGGGLGVGFMPSQDPTAGATNGGGGGGGYATFPGPSIPRNGGVGGRFGGGGGTSAAHAGDGGEFGGGGGVNAPDSPGFASFSGSGGWGGGGGGAANLQSNGNAGNAGDGGFGGGGGGKLFAFIGGGAGGAYGGNGGIAAANSFVPTGGGGGGLGGAIFARHANGASFQAIDCDFSGGSATGGTAGPAIGGSGRVAPQPGTGVGSGIFALGGTLSFSGGGTVSDVLADDVFGPAVALTKAGAGRLTLAADNIFRGDTTVTGGVLSVLTLAAPGLACGLGKGSAILLSGDGNVEYTGSSNLSLTRTFTANGTGGLGVTDAAAVLTLTTALTGTGGFAKSGAGTLVLENTVSYPGNTTISEGTLEFSPTAVLSGAGTVANNGTLSFHRNDALIFGRAISGAGKLRKRGSGSLKLSGANTFTGDIELQAGRLEIGSNAALGGSGGVFGTVRISAGTEIRAADGGRILSNPVEVLGDFGLGRATSFTGNITLSASAVAIGAANPDGPLDLDSTLGPISGAAQLTTVPGTGWSSGALVLGAASSYTLGTVVGANTRIAIAADDRLGLASSALTLAGRLRLDGTVTGTRALNVQAGNAGIETNGFTATFGSLAGTSALALSGGGTLAVGSGTFDGPISGTAAFRKTGAGTLRLNGANTFSGGLTVQAGALELGHNQASGDANQTLTLEGGAIRTVSAPRTLAHPLNLAGSFAVGSDLTFTGAASLGTAALTITADNPGGAANSDTTFGGIISGTGPVIVAATPGSLGTGAIRFSGANTYGGGTTVQAGGRLRIGSDANLGTAGTGLTLGGGGRLALTASISTTRPLGLISGGGELEFASLSASFASLDGNGALGLGGGELLISAGTYGGSLSGTGSLTKQGSGTLVLAGTNTYSGGTRLAGGILGLASNAPLGTGTITISGGNIRAVGAARTLANPLVVTGGFTVGRLTNFTGAASFPSGSITINGDNPDGPANGDSTFSGPISGGAAIVLTGTGNGLGSGAIVFSGPNSYTGGTTLGAGSRLAISSDGNLGDPNGTLKFLGGKLRIDGGGILSSRILDLQAGGAEIEVSADYAIFSNLSGTTTLTKRGSGILGISGAINHTGPIVLEAGSLYLRGGTLSGVVSGGGFMLNQSSTDPLTLSADNTYTGITGVSFGRLVLTGQSASTFFSIEPQSMLELHVAAGERDYAPSGGAITVAGFGGTLLKTGPGMARWGAAAATFALGPGSLIDVQGGTFVGGTSANEVWTNNLSGLTVAASAEFHGFEANVRVDALNGAGLIHSGAAGAGYTSFTFGVADGSGTFAGQLADSPGAVGRYTKAGTGTQILTGQTTHTGGTVVLNGGTLQIGDGGTAGTLAGAVDNAGTLAFRRSDNATFAGVVSGPGTLSHSGGTLTLSGLSPATGTLAVIAGRLILSGSWAGGCNVTGRLSLAGGALGSAVSSGIVQPGGQFDGSGTVAGALTNQGVIVAGTGESLTFTGAVTNAPGGVLRAIAGGVLDLSQAPSLVNDGLIDRISGSILLPASFTNNGLLLDSSVVRIKTAARAGNTVTVTIDGYSAHTYRLQRSTDLSGATFADLGTPQSGTTGNELTFTDPAAGGAKGFYRVRVD